MGKNIILDFFKKNKIKYIIGIIFMLLSSFIQTLFPKVLGAAIDVLKENHFDTRIVNTKILYILLIGAGTFLCTYIWRNLVIGNGRKLECSLREKLFNHMQKLSPEFFNAKKTGDLIAYSINDISAVRMTFGPAAAMSINGIVVCISSIYLMSQAINWRLTLMSLLPIPLLVFFMLKIGKIVQKRFRHVQETFASISDRVQENIYGIRVIKAYVQEEDEVKNFEAISNEMMESNLSMVRVSSLLSPVIELCFSISFVLNLIIGGNMVLKNTITLGDFIAFNTYLTMIMGPVISIGRVINIFQRGMASLKRLNEIFNVVPKITDGAAMIKMPVKGSINIKNLDFKYPGAEVFALKDVSAEIPKGHVLGVIGRTGSGKTTLVNLLLKLYNVQNGMIYIDGNDINDYELETLRGGFGYVPQDNFLFSASIKDNIKFFRDDYSDEEIEKAAKVSCIYENIENFPDKFDTLLGERGVNLSGGQKQRISIARAIIMNPAVLILDDALSAVDTITESDILNNLKEIRKDRTTIVIAHRISALASADEIIVLDEGKIYERGTQEELLSKGGLYYDIYKEQCKDTENR